MKMNIILLFKILHIFGNAPFIQGSVLINSTYFNPNTAFFQC